MQQEQQQRLMDAERRDVEERERERRERAVWDVGPHGVQGRGLGGGYEERR